MQNNNSKVKTFLKQQQCFSLFAFRFSLNRGVGLLEALVYVAIISLLTVIVVNTALVMSVASNKARLKRNILGEAGIAVERMVREVRLADSVDLGGSALGVNPGMLKLNTIVGVGDNTPTTREFYILNDMLMMKEGANEPVALTEKIAVTDLAFYHIVAGATTSEAVTFELAAEDEYRNMQERHTFNATAVMRRSY